MPFTGSVRKVRRERVDGYLPAALHPVFLLEDRQAPAAILTDRLDQREMRATRRPAAHLDPAGVFLPLRHVRHEIDAQDAARPDHVGDGVERRLQIAIANERLENAVGSDHHPEPGRIERQGADVAADQAEAREPSSRRAPSKHQRAPRRAGEHRVRSVDADQLHPGPDQGKRNAARAASELEHRAPNAPGDARPE